MKAWASIFGFLGGLLVLIAATLTVGMGIIGESFMVEQATTVTVLSLLALLVGVVAVIGGALVWARLGVACALMLISGGLTWILLIILNSKAPSLSEEIGWAQIAGSLLPASRVLELNRWGLLLAGAVLIAGGVMSLLKPRNQSERGVEKISPL